MEKRVEAIGDDYLSIPDTDDFGFSGGPLTVAMNMSISDLEGHHRVIEIKDTNTHLIRFEVVRHG